MERPYFKCSFLNGLRGELFFTATHQKVTGIHFLQMMLSIAGLGLSQANSPEFAWLRTSAGIEIDESKVGFNPPEERDK